MIKLAVAMVLILGMIGISAEARKVSKKRDQIKKVCISENPSFSEKQIKKCVREKLRR